MALPVRRENVRTGHVLPANVHQVLVAATVAITTTNRLYARTMPRNNMFVTTEPVVVRISTFNTKIAIARETALPAREITDPGEMHNFIRIAAIAIDAHREVPVVNTTSLVRANVRGAIAVRITAITIRPRQSAIPRWIRTTDVTAATVAPMRKDAIYGNIVREAPVLVAVRLHGEVGVISTTAAATIFVIQVLRMPGVKRARILVKMEAV